MKSTIGSAVFGIALFGAPALAQTSLDPMGTWLTEDGRAKIRIEHCGEGKQVCGFVVWMKDALNDKGQPRMDINNPDPAKRSRPALGMELMKELKPDEENTHFAGEIYNAENGKMYNVTISAESADELKVHGCMLKYLCGSQSWKRVADLPVPNTTKVVATTPPPKSKAVSTGHHDTAAPVK